MAADDTYMDLGLEDPEHPLAMGYGEATAEQLTTGPTDFSQVTTRPLKNGEVLKKGIDISQWQKNIDWKAVKNDGIQFAIIRAGYRGWGTTGTLCNDSYFDQNIKGALAQGIPVGVYIFSQAITPEEGREEARFLMEKVRGYKVALPLVIDFEYASPEGHGSGGRLYNAELTKDEATAVCNAFCDEAKKSGYTGMVYANMNMLNNHMNAGSLSKVWLAHYTTETYYKGDYDFWQFSSSGVVSGISGRVDMNFWFDDSQMLPFKDVSKDSWSYSSILFAYQEGLISGVTATKFEPLSNMKRCDLALMLYRMKKSPAVSGAVPFTDLKQDYYKNAVTWAYQNGIISGISATTFGPGKNVTREQLITMLYRLAGQPETRGSLSGFSDAGKVCGYARNAMCWGVETKILQGDNGKIDPQGHASRQQVAAFLTRYILNQY